MKAADRREAHEGPRIEFQLDMAQILLVVAGLLALCVTSFVLGRWTERDQWREATTKAAAKDGKIPEADAGADLTFFDRLGARAAEPHRQAAPPPPVAARPPQIQAGAAEGTSGEPEPSVERAPTLAPPPVDPPARTPSPPAGEFAVQVFAGERAQAAKLVDSLARKGFAARVIDGTKGPGSARVRVYGYKTRAEAQRGADRLKRDEKLSPWVVKSD